MFFHALNQPAYFDALVWFQKLTRLFDFEAVLEVMLVDGGHYLSVLTRAHIVPELRIGGFYLIRLVVNHRDVANLAFH